MTDSDFEELAGRIDGLAHAYLYLVAQFEIQGDLDGQTLTQALEQRAQGFVPKQQRSEGAIRTLRFLIDQLEDARNSRLLQARYQSGIPES